MAVRSLDVACPAAAVAAAEQLLDPRLRHRNIVALKRVESSTHADPARHAPQPDAQPPACGGGSPSGSCTGSGCSRSSCSASTSSSGGCSSSSSSSSNAAGAASRGKRHTLWLAHERCNMGLLADAAARGCFLLCDEDEMEPQEPRRPCVRRTPTAATLQERLAALVEAPKAAQDVQQAAAPSGQRPERFPMRQRSAPELRRQIPPEMQAQLQLLQQRLDASLHQQLQQQPPQQPAADSPQQQHERDSMAFADSGSCPAEAACCSVRWPTFVSTLTEVAQGLAHAHACGVAHGSLSCSTVLFGFDFRHPHGTGVKLADVGLASLASAGEVSPQAAAQALTAAAPGAAGAASAPAHSTEQDEWPAASSGAQGLISRCAGSASSTGHECRERAAAAAAAGLELQLAEDVEALGRLGCELYELTAAASGRHAASAEGGACNGLPVGNCAESGCGSRAGVAVGGQASALGCAPAALQQLLQACMQPVASQRPCACQVAASLRGVLTALERVT